MGLDMYLYATQELDAAPVLGTLGFGPVHWDEDADGRAIYVSGWRHGIDPGYPALAELIGVTPTERSPHIYIYDAGGGEKVSVRPCVGYWRKVNAVHAWIVDAIADGVDECQTIPLSRDALTRLRGTCKAVLAASELVPGTVFNGVTYDAEHPGGRVNMEPGEMVIDPRIAHELLPSQPGFFFGSTDYDQWYVEGVVETIEIIDAALALPEAWSFEYRASW